MREREGEQCNMVLVGNLGYSHNIVRVVDLLKQIGQWDHVTDYKFHYRFYSAAIRRFQVRIHTGLILFTEPSFQQYLF